MDYKEVEGIDMIDNYEVGGLFAVILKETDDIKSVYDVRTDGKGCPHFLIYDDGQWKYMDAKHFKPVVEEW